MEENLAHKFWREYEDLDPLERERKIEPIVKNIEGILKIEDKNLRKHTLKLALMSYFDDILEYKA